MGNYIAGWKLLRISASFPLNTSYKAEGMIRREIPFSVLALANRCTCHWCFVLSKLLLCEPKVVMFGPNSLWCDEKLCGEEQNNLDR